MHPFIFYTVKIFDAHYLRSRIVVFIHICEYSALPLADTASIRGSVADTVQWSDGSGAAPTDLRNPGNASNLSVNIPCSIKDRDCSVFLQNSLEPWSMRAEVDMDARRGEMSAAASEFGACHLWSVPPMTIRGVRTRSAVGSHGFSAVGAASRSNCAHKHLSVAIPGSSSSGGDCGVYLPASGGQSGRMAWPMGRSRGVGPNRESSHRAVATWPQ